MRTRLTWNTKTPHGKCPHCDGDPVIILPTITWDVSADSKHRLAPAVEVDDAIITGDFCENCQKLLGLSVNCKD